MPGIWYICCLLFGTWYLLLGIWYLVFGIWSKESCYSIINLPEEMICQVFYLNLKLRVQTSELLQHSQLVCQYLVLRIYPIFDFHKCVYLTCLYPITQCPDSCAPASVCCGRHGASVQTPQDCHHPCKVTITQVKYC